MPIKPGQPRNAQRVLNSLWPGRSAPVWPGEASGLEDQRQFLPLAGTWQHQMGAWLRLKLERVMRIPQASPHNGGFLPPVSLKGLSSLSLLSKPHDQNKVLLSRVESNLHLYRTLKTFPFHGPACCAYLTSVHDIHSMDQQSIQAMAHQPCQQRPIHDPASSTITAAIAAAAITTAASMSVRASCCGGDDQLLPPPLSSPRATAEEEGARRSFLPTQAALCPARQCATWLSVTTKESMR